ncbi:MAG TPA: T9SS type A sorting domain-containing protein, partial [Bacteroidetes bacterium]|nr:T9SS type A sorting domain-containing protein [Bacteroidota bacterium]
SHTVSPSTSTTYTVTGTAAGCAATADIDITVNPIPVINASATQTIICDGSSTDISASSNIGGTTFTWNQGVGAGASHTVSPSTSTTYTVTGTAAGCAATADVDINVNPTPILTATATQTTICDGASTDISVTSNLSGTNFTWNQGLGAGANHTVFPNDTITYIVYGDKGGCVGEDSIIINVNPIPVVVANASSDTICDGDDVILWGSGTAATSYLWDNGVIDNVAFYPTATMTYTLTGTLNGCSATDQIEVSFIPLAIAGFTYVDGPGTQISFTDTSHHGNSYYWDFGDGNTDTQQNPVHNYGSSGQFIVMQVISNQCNSDTIYDTIQIVSTDIHSKIKQLQLIVYPNPNNGTFKIDYMSDEKDTEIIIRIFNMTGCIVYEKRFKKNTYLFSTTIALDSYAKGIYQIQLVSGKDIQNAKIIVNSRY